MGLDDLGIEGGGKKLKMWIERGRKFNNWGSLEGNEKFYISVAAFGQRFRTNSRPTAENFTIG